MIRVAILGAGIGREHLAGYQALPDFFSVSVMCDLDSSRATEATGGDASINIMSDIAQVLADPDIDLIDVCLPPHLHLAVVLQVLEAGKQAICEKPLARSLAEVQQMQSAMSKYGGRVFPVFQYRYGLAMAQLQALRDAGLAGRALVASSETHWNRGSDYYSIPWRGTWDGEAGGAVLGHAIHSHDILCHVLGPVATLSAFTDTLVNQIETDDCAAISMRMQSGALATSSVTLGAATDTTRLRFCFEGLTAESGTAPYTPAEDTWTFTARGATQQKDIDRVLSTVATPRSGFDGFLAAVSDAITGIGGSEISFADGQRSIEFVTAIYQSARTGQQVTLPVDKDVVLYNGWSPV